MERVVVGLGLTLVKAVLFHDPFRVESPNPLVLPVLIGRIHHHVAILAELRHVDTGYGRNSAARLVVCRYCRFTSCRLGDQRNCARLCIREALALHPDRVHNIV